jgi:transcriptional regulator with XRE-family HTH domain
MNFAKKLKTMRKGFNMSQEQLAEKLGVSRQAVTKWETDSGMPDIENILAIAKLFNITADDLLSDVINVPLKESFAYESVTEHDIDSKKHYDINIGRANKIVIQSSEREKLYLKLASDVLSGIEENFKVKMDERKNRIDINIAKNDVYGETAVKDGLDVFIFLPEKFILNAEVSAIVKNLTIKNMDISNFEFDGKTDTVDIIGAKGHLEFNSQSDMVVTCDGICGRIDINQISATTLLNVPEGADFYANKKGSSNSIAYTVDGKAAKSFSNTGSDNTVELRGMNTELIINALKSNGKEA